MSTENLLDRLGALAPQQVRQELLELVLRTARPMIEAPLRAEQRFADLGLGSLGAVELHRTLSATTGLDLPLAMAFDHPPRRPWPASWPNGCSANRTSRRRPSPPRP